MISFNLFETLLILLDNIFILFINIFINKFINFREIITIFLALTK